jgi:hypothetical protein
MRIRVSMENVIAYGKDLTPFRHSDEITHFFSKPVMEQTCQVDL